MRTPGLHAEISLYQATGCYHATLASHQTAGPIYPAYVDQDCYNACIAPAFISASHCQVAQKCMRERMSPTIAGMPDSMHRHVHSDNQVLSGSGDDESTLPNLLPRQL